MVVHRVVIVARACSFVELIQTRYVMKLRGDSDSHQRLRYWEERLIWTLILSSKEEKEGKTMILERMSRTEQAFAAHHGSSN